MVQTKAARQSHTRTPLANPNRNYVAPFVHIKSTKYL